ncbi:hypothetical protein OIU78_003517 [Salix suchowensis]|nr:hypothetical protein OIU78_003517 [Salix suchowensis]
MKETDKRRGPNTVQSKRSGKTERRDRRPNQTLNIKGVESKALLHAKPDSSSAILVSDSNTGSEPTEVYENLVIHYVDDANRSEESPRDSKVNPMIARANRDGALDDHSDELGREVNQGKEGESDSETIKDSVSSQGDSVIADDEKAENVSRVQKSVSNKNSSESGPHGSRSVASDNETVDADENGEHEDEAELNQKIEDMEIRIGKLEAELREVAALEISLYSVVPEHGSSAHKVHTPARRLSRLYIHACKHWTQDKRATIARNTVSGLALISKSSGNDVPRLTFWLSNTIVLREIISQALGSSRNSSPPARLAESNGGSKKSEGKSKSNEMEELFWWQTVESVWWQALTPHMQSPAGDLPSNKTTGRLLGPTLGDQQQGSFSINLWKNAFKDALQRLCPVRAGGHECGCLPIIARRVMEQCVARLDVAMFNAILRESSHEIPTDPISDPIVDSKILPIPAGDLSFGSGAQLKNSVGNWSRWLSDMIGIDGADSLKEDQHSSEGDDRRHGDTKSFLLLNDLSDLSDASKRHAYGPINPAGGMPINWSSALNAESIVERRLLRDAARNFPYTAAPVVYTPPSSTDVSEAGTKSQLSRDASTALRKGYTSDEELEKLDSPLTTIIEPSSPNIMANGNGKHKEHSGDLAPNTRYELLREVWSA